MSIDSLRLLHLSDIHFKKLDFDIDHDLRNQLQRDVKELAEGKGSVQGVLITGDVAFSAKPEEYEIALDWLEKLCGQIHCPSSNVWTIPGNHDVDWRKIDESKMLRKIHEDLRSAKPEDLDSLLDEYLADRVACELVYESIQNYVRGFASKFKCEISVKRPFIEHNLKLNDGSILKIRGVNSTLASNQYDAEKKMFVGTRQSTISTEDGVEYLLMCHHPYSWLFDEDLRRQHWLARARIHLFGHKHHQRLEQVNNSLVMTAGAMQPSRREPHWIPRYNLLEVKVSKEAGQRQLYVKVFPRIWAEEEQSFQAEFSNEGKEEREYKLPISNWVGEETMKATSDAATANSGPVTEESAETGKVSTLPDPARELTYKFLRLPFHKRMGIVNKLGLLKDEDEGLQESDLFRRFFKRAKQDGKLKELWDEVEIAQHGNNNVSDNPYKEHEEGLNEHRSQTDVDGG